MRYRLENRKTAVVGVSIVAPRVMCGEGGGSNAPEWGFRKRQDSLSLRLC